MIIQNAILNLETGEIIVSTHRHDFVTTYFKNGAFLSVDGGRDYLKRAGDIEGHGKRWKDISLLDESPFRIVKERLVWGTRGIDGKSPLKYVFLKDCSDLHLRNILETQPQIYKIPLFEKVIKLILKTSKRRRTYKIPEEYS
jgi:hypothetical protein